MPRPDMVTVAGDFRVDDVMEVMILNGFSRVPVCGEGIDDVVGVVYAKDLMRAERDGHGDRTGRPSSCAPRQFVPETKRIAELLPEMQAGKVHLAIVVDEYGGTAGLVTLEDLLEELVGEIVDEYDRDEAAVEQLPGGDVRVQRRACRSTRSTSCSTPTLPEGDWDTVGGLMFHLLGHVPDRGRAGRVRGPDAAGRAGGPPPHRPGAHRAPAPESDRPRRRETGRAEPSRAATSRGLVDEVGVRHHRRAPQRRQVDAAQHHARHQGQRSSPTSRRPPARRCAAC